MVAFISTLVVGFAGVAIVVYVGKRRPVGAPLSWGEAMVAAGFAAFVYFWWIGVVPHQWLTYAEGELNWSADRLILEPSSWQPITVSYKTIADIVAVTVYGVALVLHLAVWAFWNDRSKTKQVEVPASRYGRPLVRKG